MTTKLSHESCAACDATTPRLSDEDVRRLAAFVPAWTVGETATGERSIQRRWVVRDFKTALAFIARIGALAEEENHHPDVHLTGYKHLAVELSTHAIGGLSRNDFILAAKIDALGDPST